MAKTIKDGAYYSSSTNGIHEKAGVLRGFLISASSASTVGTVTFSDNTTQTGTVLMTVDVHGRSPCYIMFPRDAAPRFSTGLSVTLANCTPNLGSLDFGV